MMREDGPIEYGTSIIYSVAFIFALSITSSVFRRKQVLWSLLYSALSVGLFVICMEEITWWQRLFDIESPEYFKV